MENLEDQSIQERAERLKTAIRHAGNASAVAKRIGMPTPTLNNYLAGRDMKASAMVSLAEACGVSVEWLATGRGNMLDGGSAPIPKWIDEFGHTLQEPAKFFTFCLLMATCQGYFLQIKRRPSLAEALGWVAGPYRKGVEASPGKFLDSLVAETFKDPEKTHINPWENI